MKHILILLFVITFPVFSFAGKLPNDVDKLESLAKEGDDKAQVKLGYFYFIGNGVDQNYSKALSYYESAAQKGNLWAMNNLCNMYLYGEGVEIDLPKAFQLCSDPARAGHAGSMVMIAEIILNIEVGAYSENRELAESTAFKFYEMAASRDHPHGQFMLGQFYEKGISVNKNLEEAIKWYLAALGSGHKSAADSLKVLQPSHDKANQH